MALEVLFLIIGILLSVWKALVMAVMAVIVAEHIVTIQHRLCINKRIKTTANSLSCTALSTLGPGGAQAYLPSLKMV